MRLGGQGIGRGLVVPGLPTVIAIGKVWPCYALGNHDQVLWVIVEGCHLRDTALAV